MNENKLSQLKCRKKLNVMKVKIKNIYKIKSSNISTYWYLFENKINKRKGKNFKIKIYLGWVQANKTTAKVLFATKWTENPTNQKTHRIFTNHL